MDGRNTYHAVWNQGLEKLLRIQNQEIAAEIHHRNQGHS